MHFKKQFFFFTMHMEFSNWKWQGIFISCVWPFQSITQTFFSIPSVTSFRTGLHVSWGASFESQHVLLNYGVRCSSESCSYALLPAKSVRLQRDPSHLPAGSPSSIGRCLLNRYLTGVACLVHPLLLSARCAQWSLHFPFVSPNTTWSNADDRVSSAS